MLRTAACLFVTGLALPAIAQDRPPQLPNNTIDCSQFKKSGPKEWIEAGTAVFDLGTIKDINLTNQPVTPGHFKFGGIDVYPVLEQKCGMPAQEGPANRAEPNTAATATLAQQTPSEKAGSEQDQSSPASAQTPARPTKNDPVPAPKAEIAKGQPENMSCDDRKSVYVADGLNGSTVEIAFQNQNSGGDRSGPNTEFVIRQYKSNELEWAYKGKHRQGRFIFAPIPFRERGFTLASIPFARQDSVALMPAYIRPNRNGTGEPILYLHGLHELFASHRFKIEGKTPAGLLPEAFYFDRCD